MILLHMIGTSVLLGNYLLCWLRRNKLISCELPHGEGPVAWNSGVAGSQEEIEALSPAACTEWIVASNHVILETDPSPVLFLNKNPVLAHTLTAEGLAKPDS